MNENQYVTLVFIVLTITFMVSVIAVRIILDNDKELSECKISYKNIFKCLILVILSITLLHLVNQYNHFSYLVGYLIGCLMMLISPISNKNKEIIVKKDLDKDE